MLNQDVLARINLDALLSNMEIMAKEDSQSSALAKSWKGSITFAVGFSGPRTTLDFTGSEIRVFSGKPASDGIVLFFPRQELLNNMFSGQGVGFPIPVKGLTKAKGLLVFMKLAKRMEELLKGSSAPAELKAKLMLNTIAKAVAAIGNHEPEGKAAANGMQGVIELRIKNGYAVNVKFTGSSVIPANGSAPQEADLVMEFKDNQLFLDMTDNKVELFGAIAMQDLGIIGDLNLADHLNIFLDKVGKYLA